MAVLQGVLLLAVAGGALALAPRCGPRWLPFLLAGAAGWVLAQAVKGLLSLPFTADGAAAPALVASAWFPVLAAALPGFAEELGKYVPLRWLRVEAREAALALGLGAGAVEAIVIALPGLVGLAGAGVSGLGLVVSLWERAWAVTLHAGLATVDGAAIYLRRGRWLLAAMLAHFLADLPAAQYQRLQSLRAPGSTGWLAAAEVVAPLLAVGTLACGRALWRPAGPAPRAGQSGGQGRRNGP